MNWINKIKKLDFSLKKRLGQNFLHSQNIINKIIDCNEKQFSNYIEIGPGIGSITSSLLEKECKVVAIEIDPDLCKYLEDEYSQYVENKKLIIVNEDVLQVDLDDLINKHFVNNESISLISNLPYYITSPILFKLFFIKYPKLDNFILMMQKEVGDRILAKVSDSNYNNLSIASNFFCDIHKVCFVSNSNFIPKPKIESIVLKFTINKKYLLSLEDEKKFINFVRKMFNMKRKTILNNLKNYLKYQEKNPLDILKNVKINSILRPQNLSLEQYYKIFKEVYKSGN